MIEMIKTLGKSVREYKKSALITPIFVTVEVVLEVIIPLLMADLIDKGIYPGEMNVILKIWLRMHMLRFKMLKLVNKLKLILNLELE